MKKILFSFFVFLIIPFMVKANDLEIINIDNGGILYSDGRLYHPNSYDEEEMGNTQENIKKYSRYYYSSAYLTNDNVFRYTLEDSPTVTIQNIRDFILNNEANECANDIFYIDTDDNFYRIQNQRMP